MAERTKATVLKTVSGATRSWVRIPVLPLFIGGSDKSRIDALARAALARNVLVITETEDALDHGSIINLIVVDGRVRFEVSLDSAERAGLKLSSRMLAVAHLVRMGNN